MFHVNSHTLQRGRGLGGVLSNLFRKIIPFGKSLAKTAINTGKQFVQSETGQDIINDTISSSAKAAKHVLLNNDSRKAKQEMIKSLERSGKKSKGLIKKIAKEKLNNVLDGQASKKKKNKNRVLSSKTPKRKKKKSSLLEI